MPTILELFKTQNIQSGVTAEVEYAVRDSKAIPVTSINPLIQQTGIRVLKLARNTFSQRLSETILEQELTGVRILRAASAPILYGTELVRISTRTTNILNDMKDASNGGESGNAGLVGNTLNKAKERATKFASKLGITFPQLLIPTRIALNDKFKQGLEPNIPTTLAQIKSDGAGSLVGKFLAKNVSGTPSQIGRNITTSAISGAKNSVRKLLFGTRKEGAQNIANKNDGESQRLQIFDSENQYSKYIDEGNTNVRARKDLSSVLSIIRETAQFTTKADLIGPPIPYTKDVSWDDEIELARGDLSSELALRQVAIDVDTFKDGIYEDKSNLPGSMPVGPNGVRVPTFPSKLRSNKYFLRENGNGSRYSELHKAVVRPNEAVAAPGLIAAYEKNIAYPYENFGKAVLPEQLYRNKSQKDGTYLAGPNSTITSDAYGINNGSDAVNQTRVGNETTADFVILKLSNIQFRATITGLTETFSPSWDSNKFIGNPFNYYTYSGIERSVSFNFKVFCLSCDEHNNAWEKLEKLATKVYPFGTLAYGVKPPIINFTMSNLYKARTVFIESLTYTTDDNTPWTISNGMTAPQIIDVAISLKFIEVNGAEGNIYDLARDLNCRVMPKTPAQQIIQKAGSDKQSPITDSEPAADGGGTTLPIATSTGDTGNIPSVNEGSITPNQTEASNGGVPISTPTTNGSIDINTNPSLEPIDIDEEFIPIPSSPTTSGVATQSTISLQSRNVNTIPINSSGNSIQRSSPINSITERPQPTPTVAKPKELVPISVVNPVGGGIQPQLPVEIPKPITQSEQNIVDSKIDINPNPSIQQIDSDDTFTPIPKSNPQQTPPVIQPKKSNMNDVATKSQKKQNMLPPNPVVSQPQNTSTSTTQETAVFSSDDSKRYFETKADIDIRTLYSSGDGIGLNPLNANSDDRDKRSKNWKESDGSDVFRNQGGGNSELGPFIQKIAQPGDITNVKFNEDRSIMYVDYLGGSTVEKSNLRGVVPGSVSSDAVVANPQFGFVGNTTSDAFNFIQNDPGIKQFYKNRETARKSYQKGLTPDQLAANTNR